MKQYSQHDAKIRVRAKRYLRKIGFTVPNTVTNHFLVDIIKYLKTPLSKDLK